jgi:beta-N-acetylhexosaminidase
MGVRPAADIEAEGRATADLLLRWGVNTDLAPVADVARPDTFEARARRSFSGDPAVAAGGVTAFVAGLRAGGVAATLKHFPGLGAASANTDHADGVVDVPAADRTEHQRARCQESSKRAFHRARLVYGV